MKQNIYIFKTIVTNNYYDVPTKCVGRFETFYSSDLIPIYFYCEIFLDNVCVTENLITMYPISKNYIKLFIHTRNYTYRKKVCKESALF